MQRELKRSEFTLEDIVKMYAYVPFTVETASRWENRTVSQEAVDKVNALAEEHWAWTLNVLRKEFGDDPGPYTNDRVYNFCYQTKLDKPAPIMWRVSLSVTLRDIADDFYDFSREVTDADNYTQTQFGWDMEANQKVAFGPPIPR